MLGRAARAHAQANLAKPSRSPGRAISAGGGADAIARILAARLTETWGQQVLIENRGGASGNLAAEAVARSAPDGYTMFLAGDFQAVNLFLYPKLSYDPVADFTPVSLVVQYPNAMVVPNSSPAHSVREFIAHAKANKGKISLASPGHGTAPHLAGELFKRMAAIEMTVVPYRGAAPAIQDVIPGRVDVFFNIAPLLTLMQQGQLRALAVTTAKRSPAAPDLPTLAEAGMPGFDVAGWYALFVPTNTAPAIVRKCTRTRPLALADPTVRGTAGAARPVRDRLDARGGLGSFHKAEMDKWGPLIREAGISIRVLAIVEGPRRCCNQGRATVESKPIVAAALGAAGIVMVAGMANAAEFKVLSSNAIKQAYLELVPQFERATEHKVATTWAGTAGIMSRMERGDVTDLVIMSNTGIDTLIKQGKVVAGSRVDLVPIRHRHGRSAPGRAKPDISSVAALKATLLGARSIAYSASASGVYISTELFQRLGIADPGDGQEQEHAGGERVGEVVARGDAEIGFQQVGEFFPVPRHRLCPAGFHPEVQHVHGLLGPASSWGAKEPEAAQSPHHLPRVTGGGGPGGSRKPRLEPGLTPARAGADCLNYREISDMCLSLSRVLLLAIGVLAAPAVAPAQPADTMLINGKIVTVDDRFTHRGGARRPRRRASSRSAPPPTIERAQGTDRRESSTSTAAPSFPGLIDNHAHWVRAAEHDELRFDGVTSRPQALGCLPSGCAPRARASGSWCSAAGRKSSSPTSRAASRSTSSTASPPTIRSCCRRSIITATSTARRSRPPGSTRRRRIRPAARSRRTPAASRPGRAGARAASPSSRPGFR